MFYQRHAAAQPEPIKRQLFTKRRQILLAWTLRLTNRRRDALQDLVQDAFVQFMLARTQLEKIENRTRSSQRLYDTALSTADYDDTFHLDWTAIKAPRRMQVAEKLQQICAYVCFRKESGVGSVLILRFFLDYLTTEMEWISIFQFAISGFRRRILSGGE